MSAFSDSNIVWTKILSKPRAPTTEADTQLAISQQRLIIDNALSNAIITLVSAALITAYFGQSIPFWIVAAWLVVMVGFSIASFSVWRRFRNAPQPKRVSGRFVAKAEQVSAVIGLCWGILVFAIEGADEEAITFFILLCAGKAAAFSSMSGQVPRVTARFTFACILPVLVASVISGHPHAFFMIALGIAFYVMLQRGAIGSFIQLQKVLKEQIKAERAQEDLRNAIESINDAFAIYDADGSVDLSNSRHREWFPSGRMDDPDGDGREKRLPNGRWVLQSINTRPAGGWVSVHTDISSLKSRERELVSAHREAEEASAAKGRFLSTMSHELRTPLNIINGFSKLMTRDSNVPLSDATVREYGDSIHQAGEHLLTVINDIIEYSKTGSDTYVYNPQPVAPRDLLASAITLAVGFNRLSSLEGVTVSVSPALGEVVVDELAIRRVLINLITNAFRFGGEPMDVTIRAFLREDGCPVFSVRDAGPGLTPEEVEQVFAPFFQCERHLGGDFSGTGLGLTLSRQLAQLHEGDVVMRSRIGDGTTVALVLPANTHISPNAVELDAPSFNAA